MFIFCPKCGQRLEVDREHIGETAPCPACLEPIIIEDVETPTSVKLIACPDCGREVSKRAAACPHCGAPLAEAPKAAAVIQTVVQGEPTRNVAEIIHEKWPWRIGWLLAVLGIISVVLAVVFKGNQTIAWPVVAFFCFFVMALCFRQKYIKCHRCGHEGDFKTSGGPNGCAFILLLCIGILPGLIYMFAVPTHRSCPRCGQEAK